MSRRLTLPLSPELDLASRENLARSRSMKLDIAKAMASLSQQKEAIVRLYYFESLSYVQIAERLQLSLASVKVELHRAKQQLRKSLAAYGQRPSFATIRAEADLARFSADEEPVVVRMIHAAGMVGLERDIQFSAGMAATARKALAAGAPILNLEGFGPE